MAAFGAIARGVSPEPAASSPRSSQGGRFSKKICNVSRGRGCAPLENCWFIVPRNRRSFRWALVDRPTLIISTRGIPLKVRAELGYRLDERLCKIKTR